MAAASGAGAGLTARRRDTFEKALREAVRQNSAEWDEALAKALDDPSNSRDRQLSIVYALGHMPPRELSNKALRVKLRAIDSSRNVREAALFALSRRLGAGATPDLLYALRHLEPIVKWEAVTDLAAVGAEDAFEDVMGWLRRSLSKANVAGGVGYSDPPPRVAAIAYLARYADPSQLAELASLARRRISRWTQDELEWLTMYWPEVVSPEDDALSKGDVVGPNWRALQERLRRPFAAAYMG